VPDANATNLRIKKCHCEPSLARRSNPVIIKQTLLVTACLPAGRDRHARLMYELARDDN